VIGLSNAPTRPTLGTSTLDAPVRQMFDDIATGYDALNRLITFNLDPMWDARVVKLTPAGGRTLDLGCGTGDLLERLLRRKSTALAAGVDLSRGMLKVARSRLGPRALLVRGDGERLPFRDGTFDAVVSAFVMRNVGDRARVYAEVARVLKPGGAFVQLELARPRNVAIRKLYEFYFERVMSALAGRVFGERAPYQYLAETLARWPHQDAISKEIQAAGFSSVEEHELTLGIVCAHRAVK